MIPPIISSVPMEGVSPICGSAIRRMTVKMALDRMSATAVRNFAYLVQD